MSNHKVADNVFEFIHKAGELRERMMAVRFGQEMYCDCLERGMTSPIEHMFWVAVNVLCEAEFTELNPDLIFSPDGNHQIARGIYLRPQCPVGKYRVDFLLNQFGVAPEEKYSPVIVELDGHDFHDKDKRQRSYEKARDRFLVKQGYRVLHFTGSDVVKDPFKVAFEALELVGCFIGSREEYDPADPLGQGWIDA